MEQNENTLSVLKIAPGQYPQQVEIDNDLKALQQAVGGSIGASYPFEDGEYQFLINLYTFLSFRLHLATVLHTDLK